MKVRFLAFTLLWNIAGFAQNEKLEKAKNELLQLKNNMLLVRVQTDMNKIQALESKGFKKRAEKAKKEQYYKNKELLLAFDQTFDFCPVYFFYARNSEAITNGELEGVVFDSQLHEVPAENLKPDYFIGDFSSTGSTGLTGFILKDRYFVPLEDPFPFYQRQYIFFSLIELSKPSMVEEYNSKLWGYYRRWIEGADRYSKD